MNDSLIHRNMKIARDDSAAKLGCSDRCDFPLNASERISEQALIFSYYFLLFFFLTLNFIKEIKKLVPRTLFSSMSTWEYLRTLEKCEKHEPKASASPCLYNSTMNSARFSFL